MNIQKKYNVNGVILIISCKKYISTRVLDNKYRLQDNEINGWKIFYVICDKNLNDMYNISYEPKLNNNVLTLKGNDDYIHLFEKVVKAQYVIHNLFNVKEGIIKCDDDMLINKIALNNFLKNTNKGEYRGRNYKNISFPNPGPEYCIKNRNDNEIVNYYSKNIEQLTEIIKETPSFNPAKYNKVPDLPQGAGGCGGIYYLSNNTSKIIVEYFKNINFDVFYYDKNSQSYPFIAEDVGTSFICCYSSIVYTCDVNMFSHTHEQLNVNAIGYHTHIQGVKIPFNSEIYNVLN